MASRTSLKWSKKYDCYRNSSGTCEVYTDRATSYAEKLIIAQTFKIGGKSHALQIINTNYWSQTTNRHFSAVYGHGHLTSGKRIELNFNRSINYIYGKTELTLEDFKSCEYSENLTAFVTEFFKPREAAKFLKAKKAEFEQDAQDKKDSEAAKRLQKKIQAMNYSSVKNLEAAIEKYNKLEKNLSSHFEFSPNILKVAQFYDLINEKKLSLSYQSQQFLYAVMEQKANAEKLKVFGQLDQQQGGAA